MNTRVNLLYFIEVLCDIGNKQGFDGYMDMVRKDLFPIIENVVPRDRSGVANVGTARRVSFTHTHTHTLSLSLTFLSPHDLKSH